MNHRLLPEIELAVRCCRWPPCAQGDERVREAAGRVSSWSRFDAVVRRNRINALVYRALNRAGVELPAPLRASFAKRVATAAQRALLMARESVRLQSAFAAAGIPTLVLKGSPLAILAYGDLGVKEARDIDLLVDPTDCSKVAPLLAELGYGFNGADLTPAQFLRYVHHAKEVQFRDARRDLMVDLHWTLVENDRLMEGVSARGPAQTVMLPGGVLRTLADEPTFAFLCLHGTGHSWGRLKWLADLQAFVATRSEEDVERLFAVSRGYGADRSASVALSLCHRLFDLRLSDTLHRQLERSWAARMLQHNAIASLTYRSGTEEHETYSAPWLRMRMAQVFVARGAASALGQLGRIWNSSDDRARIALPAGLAFAYHLLRIPRWLGRVPGIWKARSRQRLMQGAQPGPPPL